MCVSVLEWRRKRENSPPFVKKRGTFSCLIPKATVVTLNLLFSSNCLLASLLQTFTLIYQIHSFLCKTVIYLLLSHKIFTVFLPSPRPLRCSLVLSGLEILQSLDLHTSLLIGLYL